jgi:Family of unknown function (DUF6350)
VLRILLVTLQQALRSIVLTLFPISFIALVAWATAGSANGNTSDPIRAALWLWLGAHLVPFKLALAPSFIPSSLSYLPLGAAVFPFFAIRSGVARSALFLANERAARSLVTIWYALIATIAASLVSSTSIKPVLYLVPIYVGGLALFSSMDFTTRPWRSFKFSWYLASILFGLALVLDAISLMAHFKVVKDVAVVIQPGWVGGILFLVLQLLYLPNMALATLSYLFGLGFSMGANTQIDPFHFKLTALPAIPLLGALPTGKNQLFALGLGLLVLFLILWQLYVIGGKRTLKVKQAALVTNFFPAIIFLILISFLSGGNFVTKEMSPVGLTWWKLPSEVFAIQIFLLVFGVYLPHLLKFLFNRSKPKSASI